MKIGIKGPVFLPIERGYHSLSSYLRAALNQKSCALPGMDLGVLRSLVVTACDVSAWLS